MNFGMKEEMGFDEEQIKALLIMKPKFWIMSNYKYGIFYPSGEVLTCFLFR